jgi:choline kinase
MDLPQLDNLGRQESQQMPFSLGRAVLPRALILAAGVGRRLGGTESGQPGLPKAMLDFGGKTLLARHIGILRGFGISDITVVIGFGAEHMRMALAALNDGPPVGVVVNPDFREGSVVSLWAGRNVLRGGGSVILMDADVLYDARLMARLVDSQRPDCFLLDREIEPGWPIFFFSKTADSAARLARRVGGLFPVFRRGRAGARREGGRLRRRRPPNDGI